MQTGDFEQLYTSLPHDDLLARTQSVIQETFAIRKPAPQGKVVVLKFNNNGIAKWQSITDDTARTRKGKEFFALDMMIEAVDVIVKNTIFYFWGQEILATDWHTHGH